jgi:hypothetical protein
LEPIPIRAVFLRMPAYPSPHRIPFIAVLAVAIAAGVLAWRERLEIVRLRAELLRPEERGALAKRLDAANQRIQALQNQLAAHRKTPALAKVNGGGAPGQTSDDGHPMRMFGPGDLQGLLNNPDFRKLQATTIKGQLAPRYAPLFKELNLPPDQLAQFQNLLVEKQQAMADAMAAAREQGISPMSDPQAFHQALDDAQNSLNDQIHSVLGDSGYNQYQQYEQTQPERNLVTQLQQSLSYTSAPLSDAQANQLIQLLQQEAAQASAAGAAAAPGKSGYAVMVSPQNGVTVSLNGPPPAIDSQVLSQAQGFLSPQQMQALQEMQAQQQAQQQMANLMHTTLPPPPPGK